MIGQDKLDDRFSKLFRKWSEEDPPPQPQPALPVDPFYWLDSTFRQTQTERPTVLACIDLVVLAFFFLLRVGEYIASSPAQQRKKRTVPLRKQDLRFWEGDRMIDIEAPDLIDRATAVSMSLANQKNGSRGDWISHTSTGHPSFCPVKAAARRMDHLRGLPPDTRLCTIRMPNGSYKELRPKAVKPLIQMASLAVGLTEDKGYDNNRIGSHSIRASGAMALKLQGVDDTLIQKLGRWSSDTYKRYIRPQIAGLTAGLSTLMTVRLSFHQVT